MLEGAVKDKPHINKNWEFRTDLIEGVKLKDSRNFVTKNSVACELYRADWDIDEGKIVHMIHVMTRGHQVTAWHLHELQTDHIFVLSGTMKLVLYDDREGSSTRGKLNVFHLHKSRPQLALIPPNVWHGLQNLEATDATFVNFFNVQYRYEEPDEWRLPWNTDKIPYKWDRQG